MKKGIKVLFLLFILLIISSCNEGTSEENNNADNSVDGETLTIFTTIYPLQDFAEKIGGEYVNVENMIPPGADAHTYEPTARDMIEIADGDVFLYNGSGLEGFVEALIETVKNENVSVVEASKGISLIESSHDHDHGHEEEHEGHDHSEGHEEEHEGHDHSEGHEEEHDDHDHSEDGYDHHHGDQDPHLWLDPLLSISMAENVKKALVELKPEHEDYFEEKFQQLIGQLEQLDADFQQMANAAQKDTFIVSHAGYGYWEHRYGLHQIGITGLSGTNEPSHKQIQDIINLAEENDLNYIMMEQNIPSKMAEVVQGETNTEALYLHNLEVLMPADIENNEDYFSLMRKNIKALEKALN
ncbi:metal ABC transporter solute-binding protein, Zn/Mn family [Alkalihalobacillus sp. 1P02AB]|uniref:metal ABC transporter solute-binding protein, Zn/Mn family n=1 Tax=Alkalihalobacillus sp. 1P02AB TaxID=3132260 RepID=UPI0039A53082